MLNIKFSALLAFALVAVVAAGPVVSPELVYGMYEF
jgi:hypothetical protein